MQKQMHTFSDEKIVTLLENAEVQTQQGIKCDKKYTFRDRKKVQRNLQTLNFDQCIRKPDKRRLGGWFIKEKQKYLFFLQQNFYTEFGAINQFYDKMAEVIRTRNSQEVRIYHQKNMLKYSGIQNVIKNFSQMIEQKKLEKVQHNSQKQKRSQISQPQKNKTVTLGEKFEKEQQKQIFPFSGGVGTSMPFYPTVDFGSLQNIQGSNKYSISMQNKFIMEQMMLAKKIRESIAMYQHMNNQIYQQMPFQNWSFTSSFSPLNNSEPSESSIKREE